MAEFTILQQLSELAALAVVALVATECRERLERRELPIQAVVAAAVARLRLQVIKAAALAVPAS